MFQRCKQFELETCSFILKTATLSCIFSKFVGMLLHNMGSRIEILYLVLLNVNGGRQGVSVEKFIGYL